MKKVSINKIKPYPENAKKHSEEQVEKIANSIKEFGFNQPIVVDKDNVIIVGHGRFAAAQSLDLKDIPVIQVELTDKQAMAYRLADNKLNESDWDINLVLEELENLPKELAELTGFDSKLKDLEFNYKNTEMSPENGMDKEYKVTKCPNCSYEF